MLRWLHTSCSAALSSSPTRGCDAKGGLQQAEPSLARLSFLAPSSVDNDSTDEEDAGSVVATVVGVRDGSVRFVRADSGLDQSVFTSSRKASDLPQQLAPLLVEASQLDSLPTFGEQRAVNSKPVWQDRHSSLALPKLDFAAVGALATGYCWHWVPVVLGAIGARRAPSWGICNSAVWSLAEGALLSELVTPAAGLPSRNQSGAAPVARLSLPGRKQASRNPGYASFETLPRRPVDNYLSSCRPRADEGCLKPRLQRTSRPVQRRGREPTQPQAGATAALALLRRRRPGARRARPRAAPAAAAHAPAHHVGRATGPHGGRGRGRLRSGRVVRRGRRGGGRGGRRRQLGGRSCRRRCAELGR
jgi:hypothetical protein